MSNLEGMERFEEFLKDMGLPRTLTEAGLPLDEFELMATKATEDREQGSFKKLSKEDIIKIYELAK